jgi:hypothetical protein
MPRMPPRRDASGRRVVIREARRIPKDLSPARVIGHLFGRRGIEAFARLGDYGPEEEGPDGTLTLALVGHFWRADFLRIFGREFFSTLLEHQIRGGRLLIQDRKVMAFREARGAGMCDPVLEYVCEGSDYDTSLYAIEVRYFDTCLAFGHGASLDDLAKTFVGVGKLKDFGEAEKADMLNTFRREPDRAYAYAITDSVLTLLVKEAMEATHRQIYGGLGFRGEAIPELRSTQGSRVADMIVRCVARAAEGADVLSSKRGKQQPAGVVSLAKVKALLRKGSAGFIADEHLSQFGEQTGQTHGGLCFSRSPTQLFHEAPGMLNDVDLSGCYSQVMAPMSLYAGRPLVHEPGRPGEAPGTGMVLKDAVAFLRQYAAGNDAWIIKVSGEIAAGPNVLIPSIKGALTNANFKSRAAKRRADAQWARARRQAARQRFALDRPDEGKTDTANTALYTDEIEAGVVAWPTWLMIQALPPCWREDYENLEVDSILPPRGTWSPSPGRRSTPWWRSTGTAARPGRPPSAWGLLNGSGSSRSSSGGSMRTTPHSGSTSASWLGNFRSCGSRRRRPAATRRPSAATRNRSTASTGWWPAVTFPRTTSWLRITSPPRPGPWPSLCS